MSALNGVGAVILRVSYCKEKGYESVGCCVGSGRNIGDEK